MSKLFCQLRIRAVFLVPLLVLGCFAVKAGEAVAQRPRFDSVFQIPSSNVNSTIVGQQVQFQTPATMFPPANSPAPVLSYPSSTLQLPPIVNTQAPNTFQGYRGPFPIQPQSPGPLTAPQNVLPPVQLNAPNFAIPSQPQFQVPNNYQVPQNYGLGNAFGANQAPSFFQSAPNNNNVWANSQTTWPSQFWGRLQNDYLPRLLERPRYRHTWIQGNNGNELGLNEVELATTMTWPNWLGSNQPLRLTPGFTFHFWDGPDTAVTGFELPARTYSAFLAADFVSDPNRRSGFETNLTVGVYSDFDNFSSDSLRITGVGVGWYRINNYMTGKLGVEYFDRLDVKLLPAVGVFLAPNQDLRLDVYFPRPKLAFRLPNWRNLEAWSYVGAEYGGGSWAIEKSSGMDDQVDVNDVRAFVGLEWLGPKGRTGLAEFGYLFEREMIYRTNPSAKLGLQDAIMVRLGLTF